ncbi:hypothetical protein [uncultured Sphingomonas sp.]|uniref:hypothetical protein n=1 Tax=uncultured Sphingomonas sp. TaxID=158754 RepID=UPI0025CE4BA0|nr:hypothetical protein [uncultured Sphingomonas sp.]
MRAFRSASLRLWAGIFVAVLLSGSASAQPGTVPSVSELAPAVVDPNPGPFIVGFDRDGTLTGDADGVIASAVRSWMMDNPDVYTICYQPGADEGAGRSGFLALQRVARQLKAHGAKAVVTRSGGQCPPDWSIRGLATPYVYIMGAVRL